MTKEYRFEAVPMHVEISIDRGNVELYPCQADLSTDEPLFWAVYRRLDGTGPAEWVRDYINRIDAQTHAYEANRSTL